VKKHRYLKFGRLSCPELLAANHGGGYQISNPQFHKEKLNGDISFTE
jgi:hypothetical protein